MASNHFFCGWCQYYRIVQILSTANHAFILLWKRPDSQCIVLLFVTNSTHLAPWEAKTSCKKFLQMLSETGLCSAAQNNSLTTCCVILKHGQSFFKSNSTAELLNNKLITTRDWRRSVAWAKMQKHGEPGKNKTYFSDYDPLSQHLQERYDHYVVIWCPDSPHICGWRAYSS